MNRKPYRWTSLVLLMAAVAILGGGVQARTGHIEILGVPDDMMAGNYDTKSGLFVADVREIDGALVRITYDDVVITGRLVHWYTKEDYLDVTIDAALTQDNMDITAEQIEYYSAENRMVAQGEVYVVTEEADVYSDHLVYLEDDDEAEFTGRVRVVVDDGVFRGERFVMYIERDEMQFFGPFQGEIDR